MSDFAPLVSPPSGIPSHRWWYLVRGTDILVDDDSDGVPSSEDADWSAGLGTEEPPIFLGTLDGVGCWARGVPDDVPAPEGTRWVPLRNMGITADTPAWRLAGRAVHLVRWWRTSRFCGRCGTATEFPEAERAARCPNCGLLAYPRLSPAVIMLVRRGDEALLAQGSRFRGRMYSTLAGFVEPGETAEDAVAREVDEEVGVAVEGIRYVASQPWPFPDSLMLGFTAQWAGRDLCPDGTEILDAGWYQADDLPPVPPPLSIARRLIDGWVADVGAQPIASRPG